MRWIFYVAASLAIVSCRLETALFRRGFHLETGQAQHQDFESEDSSSEPSCRAGKLELLARTLLAYYPTTSLTASKFVRNVISNPCSIRPPTVAPTMKSAAELEQMADGIRLARNLRAEWKLKNAVDECGRWISSCPASMLTDRNSKGSIYLKYAMTLRAEWNLLMGNIEDSIAEYRRILAQLPSDRDAKLELAHALQDAKGDTAQAFSLLEEVLREGPGGQSLDAGSFCWAAQDAAVLAGALGNYSAAHKYFELFKHLIGDCNVPLEAKLLRESQATFFEMVNYLCKDDASSAVRARKRLAEMKLEAPELIMRRDVWSSSWDYIASTPLGKAPGPSLFYSTHQMLRLGMDAASLSSGLILEFGVWHGSSLRMIASHWPEEDVHGFDTFTGLPEQWGLIEAWGEPVGAYSTFGAMPAGLPGNVKLYEGTFKDTLPGFLSAHSGPIRFMNIDCDLYSSTKDIFENVYNRISPGTIIVFDEYIASPTWQQDEFKAFEEAVAEHGWAYEYLAISLQSCQAVVRII